MTAEGWRALQKVETWLDMVADDGDTPAGQPPSPDYVRALRDAPLGRARDVREAHAAKRGPPDFANNGDNTNE